MRPFVRTDGEFIPYKELPDYLKGKTHEVILFQDGVVINNTTQFGWLDRIRILFGCGFYQHIHIATEHVVGRTFVMPGNSYVESFWRGRLSNSVGDTAPEQGAEEDH